MPGTVTDRLCQLHVLMTFIQSGDLGFLVDSLILKLHSLTFQLGATILALGQDNAMREGILLLEGLIISERAKCIKNLIDLSLVCMSDWVPCYRHFDWML